MTYKVDIFHVLKKIANGDLNYILTLDDETLKAISPYLILLWGMGIDTYNDYHTVCLNEYVNKLLFTTPSAHKRLHMLLLATALKEPGARFKYIVPKKEKHKSPISYRIVREYYGYNHNHTVETMELLDNETILEMAYELGTDDAEIKKLKREMRK